MFRLGGHWYGCLFPKDPDHKLEEQQAGLLFEKRSALLQFFLNLRETSCIRSRSVDNFAQQSWQQLVRLAVSAASNNVMAVILSGSLLI